MRIMMAATALALLASGPALAFEGSYQGGYEGQTLEIKHTGGKTYSLSFDVGIEGCAGELATSGVAKGKTLVAVSKEDDNVCTIKVKKTAKGITVSEDGCLYYHGASCDFEGDYTRK